MANPHDILKLITQELQTPTRKLLHRYPPKIFNTYYVTLMRSDTYLNIYYLEDPPSIRLIHPNWEIELANPNSIELLTQEINKRIPPHNP